MTQQISDETYEKYVQEPPFVGLLQFETGTACNGKCTFCSHKDMKRSGTASWSTILEVIDQCAPYAQTVCPFWMQEPLLEPRLPAILDNVKQVNPKTETVIYTNMAKLPKWWRQLVDEQNLDTMIISFYGATPQLYRKYQPGFNWNRTRRNIKRFMAYRKSKGYKKPYVKMHYIMLPDTVAAAKGFAEEWINIVDSVGGTVYRTYETNEALEQFEQKQYGAPPKRVPCIRLWSGFYVQFNGDVCPCSADSQGDNVLGNVLEQNFRQIWWGPKAREFREKHIKGEYAEMCRNCNYYKYEMPKEWIQYWLNKSLSGNL